MRHLSLVFFVAISSVILSACGSLTGLPGHGGGKRFAVEQELVAATIRASAKDLQVDELKEKKVAVYIVGMGDQGGGNLIGGRYSIGAIIRGESITTPTTEYPVITTTTTTGATTTVAENALNAASRTDGSGRRVEGQIGYSGLGAYHSETVLNPRDAQFLSAVIQEYLVLKGVRVVNPEEADYDMYITVDIFGTIRSRNDWLFANQESLIAQTALAMTVMNRNTDEVFLAPQTTGYEAEYNEQYLLWAGPIEKKKTIRRSAPLLVDFTDLYSPINLSEKAEGVTVPIREIAVKN